MSVPVSPFKDLTAVQTPDSTGLNHKLTVNGMAFMPSTERNIRAVFEEMPSRGAGTRTLLLKIVEKNDVTDGQVFLWKYIDPFVKTVSEGQYIQVEVSFHEEKDIIRVTKDLS